MGREVRRVPANREHPKSYQIIRRNVEYVEELIFEPRFKFLWDDLYNDFKKELEEWDKEYQEFQKGKEITCSDGRVYSKENGDTYFDYAGNPPDIAGYDMCMPTGDWYQLFETVSEGTPLSPPFATSEELVDRLSTNKDYRGRERTREGAEDIVKTGYAPSMIMTAGKIYSPEQQYLINDK